MLFRSVITTFFLGACVLEPSAIFKLVIGGLTGIILVVLGTFYLHFQGPFVPISLRPVLGIVTAHVLGAV